MEIKKIKFRNHPVLGNLELDFTDSTGNPAKTIILVGENGCGKTTLLNILFDIFDYKLNETIEYREVLFSPQEQDILTRNYERISCEAWDGIAKISYLNTAHSRSGTLKKVLLQINNNGVNQTHNISFANLEKICTNIYAMPAINHTSEAITNITYYKLDDPEHILKQYDGGSAKTIKQTLVDIRAEDAEECLTHIEKHGVASNNVAPRLARFKNAFSKIFINLKLTDIVSKHNQKNIIFQKDGQSITVDQLSSGEKQIVFRGGFFLINQNLQNGKIALIDEPEISMHPKWQEKILNYYKQIFTSAQGIQTSQLFVATHSEHIIKNSLDDNDIIVILQHDSARKLTAKKISDLKLESQKNTFRPTVAQVSYEAFGMSGDEFHNQLYQYIETESGKTFDDISGARFPINKERKKSDGSTWRQVSEPTYIRHHYHHPNEHNSYTEEELVESIEALKKFIADKEI